VRKRSTTIAGDTGFRDDGEHQGDRQFVGALQRGLDMLRCFKPTDTALGNQDFADRTGLPKATISRLTYTLSKLGYLVYLEDSGRYRLGYACLAGLKIRETAQPYMQRLADEAGDGVMVSLGGRDSLSMIYIACARSVGIVSLQLSVGSRISLARSGMGWAYLSAIDDAERETLVPQLRARVGEERWPHIEDHLKRAADEIATRGFCSNFGGWYPQVNSVAVPLRLPNRDMPVLAFNCGGPSYVLAPERLERELGPRLVDLAHNVSATGNSIFS
jgi:DNA-binding IclR family transcriptional regulator